MPITDFSYAIGQDANGNIIATPGTPQSEIDAYKAQISAGINPGNAMGQQYGTAATSPQDATTPAAGLGKWDLPSIGQIMGAFEQGIAHPFDTIGGNNTAKMDTEAAANKPGTLGSLLGIVTDLPRLGTIIIGGLLIAAGLFALAGGNKIIQVSRGA